MSDRGGDDSDDESKTPHAGRSEDETGSLCLGDRDVPSVGEATRARSAVLSALFPGETRVLDGRYELGSMIGSGGLGRVYKALDTKLGRHVAVKFLKGATHDPELAKALEGEARVLARLQHPNIVAVHDVGRSEDELYLTMELIDGVSLETWLRTKRSWREVVDVMRQAALGLSAAHEAGVVHRDFKPANVMLDRTGRVRVVDFGLAREVVWTEDSVPSGGDGTLHTKAAGTPPYMAPEQFEGEVSAASDQFAFCTTLYEGLCGKRPWTGRERGVGHGGAESDRLLRELRKRRVPRPVRRVVERGVLRDAAGRFPKMSDLDRGLARSTRKGSVVLGGLGLALFGAVGFSQLGASNPCDVRPRIDDAWTADARNLVQSGLRDDASAPSFLKLLDTRASVWRTESRGNCESHRDGKTSPLLYELRRRCLNRTSDRFDYALGEIEGGSFSPRRLRATLVPALDIQPCLDDEALIRFGSADGEPVDAAAFDEIERGIGRAYVQLNLGNEEAYLVELEGLHRAHGSRPDVGQAAGRLAFQYGTALSRRGEFDDAERVMRDALLRYAADPRALVANAELRSGLAVALSMNPKRAVEARNLADDAIVVLRAKGLSPTQLPAQTARARASALLGDEAGTLDALRVIEAILDQFKTGNSAGMSWSGHERNRLELGVLGAELRARIGRQEEASARYAAAILDLREAGAHPRVLAQALNNAGELMALEEPSEAAALLVEEAAAIKSTYNDGRGAALSWMTAGTIRIRNEQGDAAASAYEQALAVLPPKHEADRFEILYNLGLAHQQLGAFGRARATLQEARAEAERAGLEESELRYNLEVAILQVEISMQSRETAQAALDVVRRLERRSYSPYTRAEVEIAACEVNRLSEPELAKAAIRSAEALVREVGDPGLKESLERCRALASERG